jgi:hypothetical protein
MKRFSLSVLTLLLFVSAFSAGVNGNQVSNSEKLFSIVNKEFEIYAARRADLERASEAVSHARRVFQKYFGKDAPKIALVLYDTPAQAASYDETKFRERGLGLLKWSATSIRSKFGVVKELGAVAAESPDEGGRPQVLDFYAKEPFAGITLQKNDIILSINDRPVSSVEDFMREMKAAAIGSNVMVRLKRGGRVTELKFVKSAKDKPDAAASAAIQNIIQTSGRVPIGKSLIAHEAMHELMREGLSNSLNVPAWFNEGLASLAEMPEDLRLRRLRMIEFLDKRVPLNSLFTMMHPATGGQVMQAPVGGGTASGMPVMVTNNNPAGIVFYEQSMTLLEFLSKAEGEKFVGRIGESLARGESMEKALKAARKAPADLAQLEAGWMNWLKRQ